MLRAVAKDQEKYNDINSLTKKASWIRDVLPGGALSIDNFLDAHSGDSGLELCGKLAILKTILDAESGSPLMVNIRDGYAPTQFTLSASAGTWLGQFFKLLTENVHRDRVEQIFDGVGFVIFNYDRCFEHFMVRALHLYYDISEEMAHEIVTSAYIYHPFGTAGLLPWQSKSVRDAVNFGDRGQHHNLFDISSQIKTFTERLEDVEQLTSMRKALNVAQHIVFLGFAFHPQNVSLLLEGMSNADRRIFATTKGISQSDCLHIRSDLSICVRHGSGDRNIHFLDGTCYELFREHWRGLGS